MKIRNLVDMKMKKSEQKALTEPAKLEVAGASYPWGLEIRLEKPALKKLGISAADYKAGSGVGLVAEGKVKSVSISDSEGGGGDQSICIQITKLKVV